MGQTVNSGQLYNVTATQHDTNDIVLSGGTMVVDSGGVALATTVSSGGSMAVASGGTASGTIDDGTLFISAGGLDSGSTVNSGGANDIEYVAGTAIGATVVHGDIDVLSGGTDIGAALDA